MHRWSSIIIGTAAAVLATTLVATPAMADDPTLSATYPVNGSTHLASTNSDLALGPGTIQVTLNLVTSAVTGSVVLPPATGSFTELGFIPVVATTQFIETEPTTGTVDLATSTVRTQSHITLKLTSLKVAGLPVLIGDHCQTSTPAVLDLASQPGFNVLAGGQVAGSYTIPQFDHCLLATPLINLTIPGAGNTITLTLGPAVLG